MTDVQHHFITHQTPRPKRVWVQALVLKWRNNVHRLKGKPARRRSLVVLDCETIRGWKRSWKKRSYDNHSVSPGFITAACQHQPPASLPEQVEPLQVSTSKTQGQLAVIVTPAVVSTPPSGAYGHELPFPRTGRRPRVGDQIDKLEDNVY